MKKKMIILLIVGMVAVMGLDSVVSAAYLPATITAASSHGARPAARAGDDSGMSGDVDILTDTHSNDAANHMWLSGNTHGVNPNPGTVAGSYWIKFDLGAAFNLGDMGIWNYNELNYPHFGMNEITIEYSTDNANYTTIYDGPLQLANAGGLAPSPVDLVVDFAGASAQYVVITSDAFPDHNHKPNTYAEVGLSEVRLYEIPEPATMALLGLGGLGLLRRRQS